MHKSDVISFYGSGVAVAKVLKISSSAVSQWSLLIPEKQAYRLEKITQGQLKVNPTLYMVNESTQIA